MPLYLRYGTAQSLFEVYSGKPFSQNFLYVRSNEFGIRNADGSTTYFYGTGLVWNSALGEFTAGKITAIKHYSGGAFNDKLEGLNISASVVQDAFETFNGNADLLRALFLKGNDVLDGRYRLGGATMPVKLLGFDGNDLIYGGKGDDKLWGLNDFDTIRGGDGNDFINGGIDDDLLLGETGSDIIIGDGGADTLDGGEGDDVLHGGAGDDIYRGGSGINTAVYTRSLYDLIITKTSTGFKIIEPHGDDRLTDVQRLATDEGVFIWDASTSNWKQISATPGALFLSPDSMIKGTSGAEAINLKGTSKSIVMAFGGDDTIKGGSAYDLILGGNGNDLLTGDVNDAAYKTTSNDRLYGDAGNDTLYGFNGDDLLYGGTGNDLIVGGNGDDTITGGAGADVFRYRWSSGSTSVETWGNDTINDFQVGVDHLDLVNGPFSPPKPGSALVPTLTQTSDGLLVSLSGAGTILLKDVNGAGLSLDDLLI